MANIKYNFAYNLILTVSNYVFPLIVFPYVSRVLGVNNIGICNYVDSIISYFVLFSMLGIGSLGVREIARCGNDFKKRSYVASNLIICGIILTIIASIILVCLTLFLPLFEPYREYLYVGLLKLFFNVFLIEWFFQGIQNFKYITIRSIVIKSIYVISILIFVKDQNDALIYYFLTCCITVLNALCNWHYSKQFFNFGISRFEFKLFIIPILSFGYYRILTSLYTTFNTFYLGSVCGDEDVGYFTTAQKLIVMIMAVFTAFTTVMIPKVTQIMKDQQKERLQKIADDTFSILTKISIPIIAVSLFAAPEIIYLLAGSGYDGAIVPFRIMIMTVFIVGMEQIVIQQFLMATAGSRSIVLVSSIGAFFGLTLNFILTPQMASIGSSIAWCVSELVVLLSGIVCLKRKTGITFKLREFGSECLVSLLYFFPLLIIYKFCINRWISLLLAIFITILVFLLVNCYLSKSSLLLEYIQAIKNKHIKNGTNKLL